MGELNRCLAEKLEYLKKMLEETERAGNLLKNNDLDALNLCISKKDGYIESIDDLDRCIAALPGQGDSRTAQMRREIHALLKRLVELDSVNAQQADGIMESFVGQIRDVHRERSLQAYNTMQSGAMFVDREG